MTSSVAEAILELLTRHGVRRAFGIPGVHNLPFWDCNLDDDFRIVGVRHEQAAAYAADGLYRATGQFAAALLTSGPGAANALAAFGEAYVSGSPLLALASDVSSALKSPDGERGILHEMKDQAAMFAAFGATARTARTKQEAMAYSVMAVREALARPPAAGYVGIPTDVLGSEWTAAVPHIPSMPAPSVDPHEIAAVAELIATSERIVVWLGGGVVQAGAEDAVRDLVDRTGAIVLTSFAGRGLLAGHPGLVEQADLLLVLGSSFDGMNTKNWKIALPDRRAAICLGDVLPRTIAFDALVKADLAPALPLVGEALDGLGYAGRSQWTDVAGIRPAIMADIAGDPRTSSAAAFVEQVQSGWPTDGAVICDMAVSGYWVGNYTSQPRPRRLQYPVGWGTLGYALPAAIGPASVGIPTLAVCGDGGPMFALGELATFAQEALPITLLIVDDGGYGMLRFDQQVFGHPERGVDLLTPDWVQLGSAFGIDDVTQVSAALDRAHDANCRGEARIVVWKHRLYPPRTTSPRWHE